MRRLTKAERAAMAAVLTVTATVAATGISLLKKHAKFMAKKAAATFKEEEDLFENASVEPELEEDEFEEAFEPEDDGEEAKERQYIKL